MWIQDLREICEKSFDNREAGQLEVESIRVKWQKAFSEKETEIINSDLELNNFLKEYNYS